MLFFQLNKIEFYLGYPSNDQFGIIGQKIKYDVAFI